MRSFFLFFFLTSLNISAQFVENWQDSEFATAPIWQGDISRYKINTSDQQLNLDAIAESSSAFITTPSTSINNANWEFSVKMEFNPSSSNYVKIFLTANQSAYNDDIEGYYVMVGNTQDEVSLWRRTAGTNTKIIDGTDKILDSSPANVSVLVKRDDIGNWQLFSKLETESYKLEGEANDVTINNSSFFGIYCKYSATRSKKISFGPITVSGSEFIDTAKPKVISHQLIAGNQFSISFSKNINPLSVSINDFDILGQSIHPNSVSFDAALLHIKFEDYLNDTEEGILNIKNIKDEYENILQDTSLHYSFKRIKLIKAKVNTDNRIQLIFNKNLNPVTINSASIVSEFNFGAPILINDSSIQLTSEKSITPDLTHQLTVSGVESDFGDMIKDSTFSIIYQKPERYDIVFTELMPDPTPNIELFDTEYIEIYNRRDYAVNLEGMIIDVNGKQSILKSYELQAHSHVVLINQNKLMQWPSNMSVLGINNLSALSNSAGTIILYHPNSLVSDVIQYPLNLDETSFKYEGGWSFERIDYNNHQQDTNWAYSNNLDGGTPGGAENSVLETNPDVIPPYVKYISFIDSSNFEFIFSEPLKDINNINSLSIEVEGTSIANIIIDSIFHNRLRVSFTDKLPASQTFKAHFTSPIIDYANNTLDNQHSLRFGVPEPIDSFDICINELLFNPVPEGVDFVELYNRSNKILNKTDIFISSLTDMIPDELENIDGKQQLFFPNDYVVITEDLKKFLIQYPTANKELINAFDLPSLKDDEGNIAITKNTGEIIDYFAYNDDMHFELLRDDEGVSLERIKPNTKTNTPHNWHSASKQSGYATPTQKNSQFIEPNIKEPNKWINLNKPEFSPNADGTDDFLIINYILGEPGWSGTITIFNRYGQRIKILADNELLGTKGFFTWDGITDNNKKASMGIYVIFADLFSAKGEKKQKKMTAVVTAGAMK